jgi:hypothetical protein
MHTLPCTRVEGRQYAAIQYARRPLECVHETAKLLYNKQKQESACIS